MADVIEMVRGAMDSVEARGSYLRYKIGPALKPDALRALSGKLFAAVMYRAKMVWEKGYKWTMREEELVPEIEEAWADPRIGRHAADCALDFPLRRGGLGGQHSFAIREEDAYTGEMCEDEIEARLEANADALRPRLGGINDLAEYQEEMRKTVDVFRRCVVCAAANRRAKR